MSKMIDAGTWFDSYNRARKRNNEPLLVAAPLKKCPFCGGEADILPANEEIGCLYAYVYCTRCCASTTYFDPENDVDDADKDKSDLEIMQILVDKAVDAWNRRV